MDQILVVDDDAGYVRMVSKALALGGYHVLTARNGREALSALQHGTPAAILLDLSMPVMDGRAFARELQGQANPPPLIVVTGAGDGRKQAADIGAADYMPKPFDPVDLLAMIARARNGLHPRP